MLLVDSHCHLDMLEEKNDLPAVFTRAAANQVGYFLNVCVALADFPQVLAAALQYPFVVASVGLHPNEDTETVTEAELIKLGQHPKVVAIGETGLDYYRSTGDLTWQQERFRAHIRAAKALNKPLIVHTRQASADTLTIMREEGAHEVGGVMHCFSEDLTVAHAALDMNFVISFSGVVTFKNATTLQEVARKLPADKILVETDSPYLAPHPHRGKPNEPGYVRYTADFIAALRQEPIELFAQSTTDNFFNLFKGAERPHV